MSIFLAFFRAVWHWCTKPLTPWPDEQDMIGPDSELLG